MKIESNELRNKYLEFFAQKGHAIIPSAPLVPENDPSVLFNTAGMQPLVPYLLGQAHPLGTRLVDAQKCVRTVDIEDVGDNTHLSFFEMLGNWSLGDYFKDESIRWSHEFLTDPKWLNIPASHLSVTVFAGDENAPRDDYSADIWRSLGIPDTRISYLAAEDNWWAAGPTGPCGPDTEIFFWVGAGEPDPMSNVEKEPKKWMEIWNNVFMEYNRNADGILEKLPSKNVDTGMGLERITATLNGVKSVYETDMFIAALALIKEIVGENNYQERSGRIIADHVRTGVHMISDGVYPKNVEQGYILRRLLRRAIREFYKMGYEQHALAIIGQHFIEKFEDVYEVVGKNKEIIITELNKEEDKFGKTLKAGEKQFLKLLSSTKEDRVQISGKEAFDLYQTYGFPIEMIEELAKEHSFAEKGGVDTQGFATELEHHQALSRTATEGKFKGGLADTSEQNVAYHTTAHLMLAGLRKVLGEHVLQSGSNITSERIRFDFSHPQKVTPEELAAVEAYVNTAIASPCTVTCEELAKEEAKNSGAHGAFWERYPDIVKVYTITGANGEVFSKEICGGPHVESSTTMGTFKIQKEEASSSGVRRIKAILQ